MCRSHALQAWGGSGHKVRHSGTLSFFSSGSHAGKVRSHRLWDTACSANRDPTQPPPPSGGSALPPPTAQNFSPLPSQNNGCLKRSTLAAHFFAVILLGWPHTDMNLCLTGHKKRQGMPLSTPRTYSMHRPHRATICTTQAPKGHLSQYTQPTTLTMPPWAGTRKTCAKLFTSISTVFHCVRTHMKSDWWACTGDRLVILGGGGGGGKGCVLAFLGFWPIHPPTHQNIFPQGKNEIY